MKKLFLLLVALSVFWIVSCKKKTTEPGIVSHLKGRLVEHCNNMKPMANYNLYVTQKDEFNMNVGDVGVDTTDAEGYFDIACPGLLQTPIKIEHRINETNVTIIYSELELDKQVRKVGNDYDFATIFYRASWGSNVHVEIGSDHHLSDSLIIGFPGNPTYIHPMQKGEYNIYVGYDKLSAARSDTAYSYSNLGFFWGIGKRDYDSAKNYRTMYGSIVPQYNLITTKSYPCMPSSTNLYVP